MMLKWFNTFDQWVIKEGFEEIRYKKEVNEAENSIKRIVSCYTEKNLEGCPDFELVETFVKNSGFPEMYILNNEGKTVEKIN